jgi:hypothetical protein
MSFEAVAYYERVDNTEQRLSHANMAITGFVNSIGLCESSNLQDTLRLLTLWFQCVLPIVFPLFSTNGG